MTNRERARLRNWQKARLIGFNIDEKALTPIEIARYRQIMDTILILLDKWDENSQIFLGHPLPPYKCRSCGKRSNIPHILYNPIIRREENHCAKHYKIYNNE